MVKTLARLIVQIAKLTCGIVGSKAVSVLSERIFLAVASAVDAYSEESVGCYRCKITTWRVYRCRQHEGVPLVIRTWHIGILVEQIGRGITVIVKVEDAHSYAIMRLCGC